MTHIDYAKQLREIASDTNWPESEFYDLAADEIDRLRKALEMAGKRLYKEGAPQSYVDDVEAVLNGIEVEYYDE